jgi:tyrosyl-tRNA synthetase
MFTTWVRRIFNMCSLFSREVKLVNNIDWYKNMNIIAFLRDVGKHFRVQNMLDKDSVKNRMESEEGISFTEFSYQSLQAYDFYNLLKQENCTIQLGGSDQWGNITAGCDLIHRLARKEAHGLTVPLLTTATGQKIGKSEGLSGTVWLSEEKTSVYDFYQYFLRTEDVDVIRFLKVFTFLPLEEIKSIEVEHNRDSGKRIAHQKLAEEVTKFVHGEEALNRAKNASSVLFGKTVELDQLRKLTRSDIESPAFASVPKEYLPRNEVVGVEITKIAAVVNMSPSKGILRICHRLTIVAEAKRTILNGGLYLNNTRVDVVDFKITEENIIDNCFCLLKVGKKNLKFIVFK